MASNMQPHEEVPTVRPSNADPLTDAQTLRKAMKGFGTDEAAIINVLTKRTNAERLNIERAYKQSFGKDLIKDLKSELGGRLELVVLALMTPRDQYIAQVLRKAMAGIGTKERILVDVLCSSTNHEIQAINAAYARLFNTSIERDLSGDTSGHFRRLLISMNTGGRSEGTAADSAMAAQDAQNLLQAGVKKWGTDESAFNAVLATRSWPQLRLTFHEYEKIAGHSLEKAIQGEFSGDIEKGMLAIVKCAKNRAQYFAERLHDSVAGLGTKDDDLIFIIVARSEVDLESIKQEYHRLYNKSLASDVSGDTSGDYKKILLALIG
jgi:annexin A7/11